MQRLFSMFPAGSAGVALLLLRVAVILTLYVDTGRYFDGSLPVSAVVVLASLAVLIGIGLATPICAAIGCLLELVFRLNAHEGLAASAVTPVLICLALMLLGPGAYSVDGRLFGRRLVVFGDDKDPR